MEIQGGNTRWRYKASCFKTIRLANYSSTNFTYFRVSASLSLFQVFLKSFSSVGLDFLEHCSLATFAVTGHASGFGRKKPAIQSG